MKTILIIVSIVLCSCGRNSNSVSADYGFGLNLITIDSCQYVLYNGVDKCAIAHHGNCHNPIHK
jgi:hypothetical protein